MLQMSPVHFVLLSYLQDGYAQTPILVGWQGLGWVNRTIIAIIIVVVVVTSSCFVHIVAFSAWHSVLSCSTFHIATAPAALMFVVTTRCTRA